MGKLHAGILLLFVGMGFSSCVNDNEPEIEKGGLQSGNQYVPGHLASFMIKPDILFKYDVSTATLYATERQSTIDLNHPQFVRTLEVSDSIKTALDQLFSNIPNAILSNSNHDIGDYGADMGFTYLEIDSQQIKYYWRLQSNQVSPEIEAFKRSLDVSTQVLVKKFGL
jgi:hypothetical protein